MDRDSQKNKNKVLTLLTERAERASQGKITPMCVFPEGTVSNGRSLMKFKKGAFLGTEPIKVMALKWGDDTKFSNSMSNINIICCVFFAFCQPQLTLEVHEVDQDFDPDFSFKRRGIKREGEDSWQYVADDVKDIISFMTGYEKSDQGFKELKKCEILQDSIVLGTSFGFTDSRTDKYHGFLSNKERKYWEVSPEGELLRRSKDDNIKKKETSK